MSARPKATGAAVGFTVKSGWASVVLLETSHGEPAIADSRRLELCDPSIPEARQPYHAGFGTARSSGAALHRLVASVEQFGTHAVIELLTHHQAQHRIIGAGIVAGSLIDPATIANAHIRIHALEGRLFRQVIEAGARDRGIETRTWRDRDLYAEAATILHRSEASIRTSITALGRAIAGRMARGAQIGRARRVAGPPLVSHRPKRVSADARPGDRIEYLDVLRGFALTGVCAANLFIFSGLSYMTEAQRASLPTAAFDRVATMFELVFIETKFMGLFAMLFGASFWLFLDRANARGLRGSRLFYRRLAWLFVIGAIHGWLFWCFDILRFYALWGLLLPVCLMASQRTVLRLALACSVLVPAIVAGCRSAWFMSQGDGGALDAMALQAFARGTYVEMLRVNWIYDWFLTLSVSQISYQVAVFGRMVLGLYVMRAGIPRALSTHAALFRRTAIAGGLVGVTANIATATHIVVPVAGGFTMAFVASFIEETGYLALSTAYASALALLFQSLRWMPVLRRFASIGQMALTWYLTQTLVAVWFFYGFMPGPRLMGRVGGFSLLVICALWFAIQALLASVWLRRYRYGPMEWVWRSLTYWQVQPFRRFDLRESRP